ncbi:uncharacterized protein LOC108907148 [Anoplophora glabripennis]|uniref:uncharacterized protein LOC108907148 n=1 Tax=Anoplophora glabripennis TaxID=217634 RepID=UPI0008759FDC|nr:uncharacterized protein LOC108907148 [Anoplophora glabripennis]
MIKKLLQPCVLLVFALVLVENRVIVTRSTDNSVRGYLTERICWWNEVCKEEFQSQFRCKCPEWSFCRAPGRYYNAFCSMTATGYIWNQPGLRGL